MILSQEEQTQPSKIICILGPTSSGKSEAANKIAQLLETEIVSADAFQVYRGMDIGTSKPSAEIQREIPYHLIDVVNPDETFNVSDWVNMASEAISNIHGRDKIPIICGGTGMYVRALLSNWTLADTPRDQKIRSELEERAKTEGKEALWCELHNIDPDAAQRIHHNDLHRITRALEVFYSSGVPFSQLRTHAAGEEGNIYPVSFAFMWDRDALNKRISTTVHRMVEQGLEKEVESLMELGYSPELNSMKGLGYREFYKVISGEITRDQAVDETILKTKRYAKRQMTWFRREEHIHWLSGESYHLNELVDFIRTHIYTV